MVFMVTHIRKTDICKLLILIIIPFILCSCGKSSETGILPEKGVEGDYNSEVQQVSESDSGDIVDLTAVSRTMIYSTVYNLLADPDDSIGKTIKISGKLGSYEADGELLHACLVTDVTECCELSLEFEADDSVELPEDGSEITVTGEFQQYKDSHGIEYAYLKDATVIF